MTHTQRTSLDSVRRICSDSHFKTATFDVQVSSTSRDSTLALVDEVAPIVDKQHKPLVVEGTWFQSLLETAIARSVAKYAKHVRSIYDQVLDCFHASTLTQRWRKQAHEKSFPPVKLGGISFSCTIRVWFLEGDDVIYYAIRSPGDREDKHIAAAVIAKNIAKMNAILKNIVENAESIEKCATRERTHIVNDVDGTKLILPFAGVIQRGRDVANVMSFTISGCDR
jgi:hypothetical protein